MLHLLTSIWSAVTEVQETKILFLGNSNSGKTALCERFKIILQEGPRSTTTDADEKKQHHSETQKPLGGLESLKAELEKKKLIEEKEKRRKEKELMKENGDDDENNNSSSDDDDDDENNENKTSSFKPVVHQATPLPRFMTPTVGLNVGRGEVHIPHTNKKVSALLWDVGAAPELRQLWFTYIVQCHGVVFTIDLSADQEEQNQSVKLLHLLMQRPELAFAPFLIVGTKRDLVVENERKNDKNRKNQHHNNNNKNKHSIEPLQTTMSKFKRMLQFEKLPFTPSFLHDSDLINTKTGTGRRTAAEVEGTANNHHDQAKKEKQKEQTTEEEETKPIMNGNNNSNMQKKKNSEKDDNDFVPIDVDSLLADDAIDAVNAVPGGSVSGICGHMYHCAIANSKDLKFGSDLQESLYWILGAAQSSRARTATLQNLEENLSESSGRGK